MFSTQLRSPKILLVLTAFAGLLFSYADSLRADQPQTVELTLMFRVQAEHFDSLPMPYGEDAIGIVLDGPKPPSSTDVGASGFSDSFDGTYELTDGRYLAKGGATYAQVLSLSTSPLLPQHGFISLKKCEITEYTSSLATLNGGTYTPDPYGSIGLVFIRGLFEVQ